MVLLGVYHCFTHQDVQYLRRCQVSPSEKQACEARKSWETLTGDSAVESNGILQQKMIIII